MAPTPKYIRLLEKLDLRRNTITLLYETSRLLNSSLSVEELLKNIKTLVIKKIHYDYFSFFLLEDKQFVLKESFMHPNEFDKTYHLKFGKGITGYVAKTGKAIIVNDVNKDKNYIKLREEVKSELAVPITIDNKIIGVINIESKKLNFFTNNDLFLISAIAEQTAVALKNLLAQEQLEHTNKRLQHLNEIGKVVNSSLNLDIIFKLILDYIHKERNYDFIAILLIKKDRLYSRAGIGFSEKELRTYSAKLGEGICGIVAKVGKPILANDVTKVPYYINQASKTKSELGVPIKFKEKTIGVLNVESEELNAFNKEDLIYLSTLGDQVASAIQNAKLYQETKNFNVKLKKEIDHATKELVGANIELTRLNQIKSEFVSTVSHELRTPLTSIIGYVSIIKDGETGKISDTQKEFLGIVNEESERLLRLISDLLDISKIESGKMNFVYERLDMLNFLKSFEKEISSILEKKDIALKLDLPTQISIVKADSDKLKQILHNLISNAVKFSNEGTTIKIRLSETKEFIQVDVADQGIGIAKEDLDKLFKKFSQIDSKMTRKVGGTGLGLAICDYLAKQHGGKIWVKSELGKGSTFSFTIGKKISDGN